MTTESQNNANKTGASAPARHTSLFNSPPNVLELGESVSVSIAGRYLAKLGADVTRIRPTSLAAPLSELGPTIGEGTLARSAVAEWLNDGKTVIDLDVATAEGGHRFDEHVRRADVILISGTSEEWAAAGKKVDDIKAAAPVAVIGHITPWGDSGLHHGLGSGELPLQAMGGMMNLVGVIDREPIRLGGRPMQGISGMLILDAVMIGLFRRQGTGRGARFSTSDFESVVHTEWKIATFAQAGRRKELRGEDGGGPVVVRTRDGHFALFFVPKNWEEVKKLIGDPRLHEERFADDKVRAHNQDELRSIIEETTRSLAKKDLYYRAQALGIPAGHVATMSDLLSSPQYRARSFFESHDIEGIGRGELPDAPWQVITENDLDESATRVA